MPRPKESVSVFWFRRDLRLQDNTALYHALNSGNPVLPIFIFDQNILADLEKDDARVGFIHDRLCAINNKLRKHGSSVLCLHSTPVDAWRTLQGQYKIDSVFFNRDYEPYAIDRDQEVSDLLTHAGAKVFTYKDQVIFEQAEIVKSDEGPYTVYSPYKRRWLEKFGHSMIKENPSSTLTHYYQFEAKVPSLEELGFKQASYAVHDFDMSGIDNYSATRDFPATDGTSHLSPHLRFGTISIREIIRSLHDGSEVFLSELIWREFFMQILFHFPHVVTQSFRPQYDQIQWINDENDFAKWCGGTTGYPMVDAGMRQLNTTGYMHNRVRMVVASFLCKHLLIDWRWGEAYFAKKLLDYDLSANNGNWQWAAGTGCDAAPYFRIFNPTEQLKKFDKNYHYVRKWVPEFGSADYPLPMIDHRAARKRALETYQKAVKS